uniref:Kazal domain containing protein n=1 Tax=Rhipicephalus zambeziensis TaxID=60191 RepID=A0A224YLP8_9ACAR
MHNFTACLIVFTVITIRTTHAHLGDQRSLYKAAQGLKQQNCTILKTNLVALGCCWALGSSDWLPQSNVLVEAGRALYSTNNCWRSDCRHSQCPGTCRCPGPISKLLGRTSCY